MKTAIAISICLVSLSLRAQSLSDNHWSFGYLAGPNAARMSLDSLGKGPGISSLVGFATGFRVGYNINNIWALRIGALYNTTGLREDAIWFSRGEATISGGFVDTNSSVTMEFDERIRTEYIDIPLTVQYNLGLGSYVFAGPSVGVLLSGKQFERKTVTVRAIAPDATANNQEAVETVQSGEVPYDIKAELNPVNISMIVGGGLNFNIAYNACIITEAQYTVGLVNTIKSQLIGHVVPENNGIISPACTAPLTSQSPRTYTRDFHIIAGMMFKL